MESASVHTSPPFAAERLLLLPPLASGSMPVVEALLLWVLQKRDPGEIQEAIEALLKRKTLPRTPQGDLDKWHLHEYIEVAAEVGAIKPQTANQARLAKDFRNLIHPGLEARRGQTCDRGTALSAVAAVEHVVRDLSP